MYRLFRRILLSLLPLSLACSSDSGNSSVPQLPVDPAGTQTYKVIPGESSIKIDIFDTVIFADDTLGLYGDNLRFVSVGQCKGVGYIIEIPRVGWQKRCNSLREGEGYVACNITEEGSTFASLYVQSVDSLGVATVKSLVPLYGRFDRFAVNPKEFQLTAEAGDTTAFIIHPTTYTATLASGSWAHLQPSVAFVSLSYDENTTGEERYDTLRLYNGYFETHEIPICQSK